MTAISISSGHGLYVRGASGSPVPPQMDEVDTARRVVNRIAQYLEQAGVTANVIHDNVSHSQSDNLDWLVDQHNETTRTYDISVHMNAYDGLAHGCEVLYTSDAGRELAQELVDAICEAGGFTNRGPKERDDLAFLNGTEEVACLIETAFCDNTSDCIKLDTAFDAVCRSIAEVLAGRSIGERPPIEPPEWPEDRPPKPEYLFYARGTMSTFGGPDDTGVSPSEGLAFFYEPEECPHLMLPTQPPGTTGMARRLDPNVMYVACRWPYENGVPKDMLRNQNLKAGVRNPRTGKAIAAYPADWGPHEEETGRAADLSPALADALGLTTDDECEIGYPI
jgi:N-acetylmuramoyl-L-alanine amidase